MDIDEIYLEIGESGAQQIKYGAAIFLIKGFTPFMVLQYTFVARASSFTCFSGKKKLMNQCFEDTTTKCTRIEYSEETIISEWDLVCERNWMAKATMSALMLGFLAGALLLGNLADRIGRKSNLMFTLLGMLFFNVVSGYTPDFNVYIISRFLVGFFVAGNILSAVVLTSELVGPTYRGIYGLVVMGAFPVGIIFLSFLAYNLQNWRSLTIAISVLGLPFTLYHWFLVESPRWLLNSDRTACAKKVLTDIAAGNGVEIKQIPPLKSKHLGGSSKESLREVFRRPRLIRVVYILCYNWLVNGAVYYGLTLASGSIGTDLYTGFALSGLVELPAVALSYIAIQRIGRRLGLSIAMGLSGAACIAIHFLSRGALEYLATSCALFGKMCMAGSFKIAYIISGEIFSTSIRNSGLGMVSACARVGSVLSPFIVMAGESIPGIQFTIFGILGLTGGLLSLWLPETKDKPLPETVTEMLIDKSKKISIHV